MLEAAAVRTARLRVTAKRLMSPQLRIRLMPLCLGVHRSGTRAWSSRLRSGVVSRVERCSGRGRPKGRPYTLVLPSRCGNQRPERLVLKATLRFPGRGILGGPPLPPKILQVTKPISPFKSANRPSKWKRTKPNRSRAQTLASAHSSRGASVRGRRD